MHDLGRHRVLWTISGGVPHSLGLVDSAQAAETKGLTFLQISDSHMGFDKPANPNAKGTLEEAIAHIKALPQKPAFMIHTGDITHLSKDSEFDDAEKIISQAKSICSARRRRVMPIARRRCKACRVTTCDTGAKTASISGLSAISKRTNSTNSARNSRQR
jgi:hypothetical protein